MKRFQVNVDVFDRIKRAQDELYRRGIVTEAKVEQGNLYLYYDENDLTAITKVFEKFKIELH